jgi:hypothetical protein
METNSSSLSPDRNPFRKPWPGEVKLCVALAVAISSVVGFGRYVYAPASTDTLSSRTACAAALLTNKAVRSSTPLTRLDVWGAEGECIEFDRKEAQQTEDSKTLAMQINALHSK